MRQLEFMGRMMELVAEWQAEYKIGCSRDGLEQWPSIRDQDDWLSDFLVWLQCKGYSV